MSMFENISVSSLLKSLSAMVAPYIAGLLTQNATAQALNGLLYNSLWYTNSIHAGQVAASVVLLVLVCVSQFSSVGAFRVLGILISLLGGAFWAAHLWGAVPTQPYLLQQLAFVGFNVFFGGILFALFMKTIRSAYVIFITMRRCPPTGAAAPVGP